MTPELIEKLETLDAILRNQDARIANLEERLEYFKRKLEQLLESYMLRNGNGG